MFNIKTICAVSMLAAASFVLAGCPEESASKDKAAEEAKTGDVAASAKAKDAKASEKKDAKSGDAKDDKSDDKKDKTATASDKKGADDKAVKDAKK